ncbi:dipeptidase PepV [Fructobacillus fructosus]|uniref:dipeptidase PepV n=1 Tax=Fructobacillus fructosus TaxID=1631 RepID=UPI002D950271|nr:Acetylornithine deacetylase/Succinyl-diaminopimelate desuccinylase or related deacylase (ArgE) [Fructobacillus fructosus]CAK1234527.1 Acetylornithine deacetylase/Succinyl-diaminopimelate desuccinylase or related deacylase (ArgE) [Fructobacillus fructosus]CAK1236122.1 Acetylornithine deacetylase/Succinyl-diaminopimelate desuccinylase or related deacylase (ArgE) [Fructobacillus fructosus]
MVDWQLKAKEEESAYLADLADYLAIPSVRDDSKATKEAPLGPGPKAALEHILSLADRDGFVTKNIDNVVGYIEIGPKDSEEYVALLAHVDVMPAGEGWNTDPFTAVIEDGKVIARGASDDKGPGLAAYYAFKMIRDMNLPLKRRVRLIFGTDEENDWTGMTRYFEVEPAPAFGFSPDAEYPIINGEKGNVQVNVTSEGTNGDKAQLLNFESGLRTNMVPGVARATVAGLTFDQVDDDFSNYLADHPQVSGKVAEDGDEIQLEVIGKQVHGSLPETGENAGTYLANFLNRYEFGGSAAGFLTYLGTWSHDDPTGRQLGVAYKDEVMGALSMNVGIIRFNEENGVFINYNFRYPKGITPDFIREQLAKAMPEWRHKAEIGGHAQVPHYVSPKDPVVKTLLNIYHDQTGLKAYDQVIGGGTYGRLMERGVAFGALFPDSPETMHQVNEFALVDDLVRSMGIYGQAIVELANLPE